MSYSLFIWHQLILACMRYFIDIRFNALTMAVYVALVCGLSWLTYNYVEQRRGNSNRTLTSCFIIALFTTGCSFYIYLHAGVVRDVPELNIVKSNVHRGMHGEYCDRVYDYKDDFPDNDKINILCVGNSYARNMGNILLESEYSNDINLSYVTTPNDKDIERINKAQIVMIFGQKDAKVNDIVWRNVNDSCKVMGIGTKYFGVCNGNHYVHRIDTDYHQRKANLDARYRDINNMWMSEYGKENYIDIIGANSTEDGRMYLFTDEGKLISQDCYHLTQAGAKWFAKRLNLKEILNIEE